MAAGRPAAHSSCASASAFCGAAASSSPPDVCGSNRISSIGKGTFSNRTNGPVWLRLRCPAAVYRQASAASHAPGNTGTALASTTQESRPPIISCRWPRKLKPVTSVAAWTSYFRAISAAVLFSVVMERMAASICSGAASPTRLAVQMSPTPSALVRISRSPGRPVSLAVRRCGSTRPVTERPYLTPVSAMECPPARMPPASVTFSAPPRRISPRTFRSMLSGKQTRFRAVFTSPPIA